MQAIKKLMKQSLSKIGFKSVVSFLLLMLCAYAYADGQDLLQGTDGTFWATYGGTGKKFLIGIEGVIGLATFMKTRNLMVFSGLLVVIIITLIVFKLAGA